MKWYVKVLVGEIAYGEIVWHKNSQPVNQGKQSRNKISYPGMRQHSQSQNFIPGYVVANRHHRYPKMRSQNTFSYSTFYYIRYSSCRCLASLKGEFKTSQFNFFLQVGLHLNFTFVEKIFKSQFASQFATFSFKKLRPSSTYTYVHVYVYVEPMVLKLQLLRTIAVLH
jgi:hypothetical protein